MKFELVSCVYRSIKQLLKIDYANIDKLFVLVNTKDGYLINFPEYQFLNLLDPNKIVFILIEVRTGLDIKTSSDILSQFEVIDVSGNFINDTYNFMYAKNWPQHKREDRINIVFLSCAARLTKFCSKPMPEIVILPKLLECPRIFNDLSTVIVANNYYEGLTNKYLQLDELTLTICY